VILQMSFRSIDLSNFRPWQSAECRFRGTLVVVHLALLFRNLSCERTKLRGCSGDCVLHEQIVIVFPFLPAKWYQKNKGLVSKSSRCIENKRSLFSQVVDCRWIVVSSWSSSLRHTRDI
jgi:hypothetical protein